MIRVAPIREGAPQAIAMRAPDASAVVAQDRGTPRLARISDTARDRICADRVAGASALVGVGRARIAPMPERRR